MSASFNDLIPELQPFARDLYAAAGAAGLMPRVTSTLRTFGEQARLYRRYQQGLQTLPVAPPGTSAHEFGYAFDMVVTPFSALASEVGPFWEQMGGVWGGEFRDPVHFEYPGFQGASPRQNGETPFSATDFLTDIATGFLPIFGNVELFTMLLQKLGLPENDVSYFIEHPSEILRYLPSNIMLRKLIG